MQHWSILGMISEVVWCLQVCRCALQSWSHLMHLFKIFFWGLHKLVQKLGSKCRTYKCKLQQTTNRNATLKHSWHDEKNSRQFLRDLLIVISSQRTREWGLSGDKSRTKTQQQGLAIGAVTSSQSCQECYTFTMTSNSTCPLQSSVIKYHSAFLIH